MDDKRYILISPDLDALYQDSEGCVYSAYEDTVSIDEPELSPCFSFVIPGLYEWVRRYENATDFADTTTDPSFDWKSWHFEGLQFAKAIWQQMPRCYTLYYRAPYEDTSHLIKEFKVDENIDTLIESFGPKSSFRKLPPAVRDDVNFVATRNEESVYIHFQLGGSEADVRIPFSHLKKLREWLEKISTGTVFLDSSIDVLNLPDIRLTFYKQTVGIHKNMGQFWINDKYKNHPKFSAYVETKLFVKGFYLSIMTALGFGKYQKPAIKENPSLFDLERDKLWEPYNVLKSHKIEQNISNILSSQFTEPNNEPINETLVMFPDYGGCIFWDTMGLGCGSYDEIITDSGNIKLNVPGLKEWSEYYDEPDDHPSFETHWRQGWELALQVRSQLPDNIDLYYMCYNPIKPKENVAYNCRLPKIIVPRIWDLFPPY